MKRVKLALSFALVLMVSGFILTSSATAIEVGQSVLAYWESSQAYYVGTVVATDNTVKGGGYYVVFEDGDQGVIPSALVKNNDIKVGSKVNARWSDGKMYPGTVAKIVGRALYIHFDDGDKGWTSWAGISIK